MRNVSNLPLYAPPPSNPPSSIKKKEGKLLPVFCELSGKYLSGEKGVIMLSERSKKVKKKKKKGGEVGGGNDKSLTLLKFLHPGAGCAETCSCWLWVRLSSLRACVKTNLPGVSSSQMEERIIWLSIVGVNEQGLATNSLRFSFFGGGGVTFSSGECLIGDFSG